ncbi:hypothetical protein C8Q80DRAFT_1264417 [Daedaleopsis nitida]|nr:hypothetical protein C8Q80DRAFT_1264417 [Daedaleopsis nitida]
MVSARNGKAAARGSRAASSQQQTASSSSPPPPQQPGQPPQSPAHASASKAAVHTRQRRVLPTRSRRGGPGVGTCETDVMILETMRRKFESEPLIPATTPFLLTTNSALVSSATASASASTEEPEPQLNTLAYGRYFDRPEVRQAYMQQQLIQTPEFTELPQDAHVGSRFRPRGSEDESVDTSDAAYEKRHRKYETFEKRQRLREKEKLKHEHYKLKERIDQLRAMDTSAFLAIPAEEFTELHSDIPGPSSPVEVPIDASNLHGAAAYQEGERRRKEMLEVALSLEQRYRTLLPPDRRWMEKKAEKSPSKVSPDDVMEIDETEEEEDEVEEVGEEEVEETSEEDEDMEEAESEVEAKTEEAEEPIEDDGESEVDPEELERSKSKKLKLRIKFPPRMLSASSKQEPKPPPSRGGGKQITLSPFFKHSGGGKGQMPGSPLRSASYTGLDTSKYGRYSVESDTLPQAPSAKKQRVGGAASAKHKYTKASKANGVDTRASVSSAGHSGKKEPAVCVLMVAAIRQSSAPTARKTQRHVTAFGTRVPTEIEEVRDFLIPDWVLASGSASEDGERYGSVDNSYSHGDVDDGSSASAASSDAGT